MCDSASSQSSADISEFMSLAQASLIKSEEALLVKEPTYFDVNCLEFGGSRRISRKGWMEEEESEFSLT